MNSCPDCKKKIEIDVPNGYVQCNNCLQFVLIEDSKPVKAIPKELI